MILGVDECRDIAGELEECEGKEEDQMAVMSLSRAGSGIYPP
jgi:hypothetical protein